MDNHRKNIFKIIAPLELIIILGLSCYLYILNQQLKTSTSRISNLQSQLTNTKKKPETKFEPVEINSLSTFSDPEYNFTFNYPENWYFEKEILLETQNLPYENYVRISSHPDRCSDCTEDEHKKYYEFFIRDWGVINDKNKSADALTYQLRSWLNFVEKEDGQPTIPGFTQKPLYRSTPFENQHKNQNISSVAVEPYYPKPNENLVSKEYVLITSGYHKYVINIITPPETFVGDTFKENNPLIKIIDSLEFKQT
jgi:hypothetical protein